MKAIREAIKRATSPDPGEIDPEDQPDLLKVTGVHEATYGGIQAFGHRRTEAEWLGDHWDDLRRAMAEKSMGGYDQVNRQIIKLNSAARLRSAACRVRFAEVERQYLIGGVDAELLRTIVTRPTSEVRDAVKLANLETCVASLQAFEDGYAMSGASKLRYLNRRIRNLGGRA